MKDQREVKEKHIAQQPPWLINNADICYVGESPNNNDNKKKISTV